MSDDPINTLEARVALAATPEARVEALNALAGAIFRVDARRAIALYERALGCELPQGSALGHADSLLGMSRSRAVLGEYERALVHCSEALAMYRGVESLAGQIAAVSYLGILYVVLGEYAASLDCQLQGLALAERSDDRKSQASILMGIGRVYSDMGRPAEALPYYDKALAACQGLDDRGVEARILNSYCVDSTNIGSYDQALEYGRRSAQIFAAIGDVYGQGVVLGSIGEALVAAGRYGEALDALEQSVELLKVRSPDLNSYEAIAVCYQIGLAHLRRGDLELALGHLQDARERASRTGMAQVAYQCHERLAELFELRGDLAMALAHYRQFHAIREKVFNEASDQKLKNLEVIHRTQQAIDEAERQRQMRQEDQRYFAQLAQLQREFFSTATHDLKNPLSTLGIGIGLLEELVPASIHEAHDVLGKMQLGIRRMHRLIGDFLDLARLETGRALEIWPVVAGVLIQSVVREHELAAGQKGLGLALQSLPDDVIIECDVAHVRRALDNLIGNAIKYTPAGGRVDVVVERGEMSLTIGVRDTGLGIPAADLANLFQPFYRVKDDAHLAYEGTGLGLTIVKAIVEQHSGAVWVESDPGRGSAFFMRLPLSQSPGAAPAAYPGGKNSAAAI